MQNYRDILAIILLSVLIISPSQGHGETSSQIHERTMNSAIKALDTQEDNSKLNKVGNKLLAAGAVVKIAAPGPGSQVAVGLAIAGLGVKEAAKYKQHKAEKEFISEAKKSGTNLEVVKYQMLKQKYIRLRQAAEYKINERKNNDQKAMNNRKEMYMKQDGGKITKKHQENLDKQNEKYTKEEEKYQKQQKHQVLKSLEKYEKYVDKLIKN